MWQGNSDAQEGPHGDSQADASQPENANEEQEVALGPDGQNVAVMPLKLRDMLQVVKEMCSLQRCPELATLPHGILSAAGPRIEFGESRDAACSRRSAAGANARAS